MMEALACHPLGMYTLEKMPQRLNLRTDGAGRHNQSPHATLEKSKSTRGTFRFLCSFGFRCANQPSMPFFFFSHVRGRCSESWSPTNHRPHLRTKSVYPRKQRML